MPEVKVIRKYKAIVFDLFGTLLKVASLESYNQMVADMAEALGVETVAFEKAWRVTRPDRVLGKIQSIAVCADRTCRDELGVTVSKERLQASQILNEDYVRSILRPREEAYDVIKKLKEEGHRIALLSDCYYVAADEFDKLPFAPFFDVKVFSCREGLQKPHPGLYERVCARLDVSASSCLYIGDGGGKELTGALEFGMTPLRVDNDGEDPFPIEKPEGIPPIRDLQEIFEYL